MDFAALIEETVDTDIYHYGFSDLTGLLKPKYRDHPRAITLVRKLDDDIIDELPPAGPTQRYYDHYMAVNSELTAMLDALSVKLAAAGIGSVKVHPTFEENELTEQHYKTLITDFSHKMAATRAGLGWIGKTALFISEKHGPRVRLATLLTDAALPVTATPCDESRCGDCETCVRACPAQAANGRLWKVGLHRDGFFDAFACREKCRELTARNIGATRSICGICVAVCPIGRKPAAGRA